MNSPYTKRTDPAMNKAQAEVISAFRLNA